MKAGHLKYLSPLLLYVFAIIAFHERGLFTYLPLVFALVLIPIVELLISPDNKNLSLAEEELARKDPVYDVMLYAIVVLQYGALYYFLNAMSEPGLLNWEKTGRILSMGLLCGTFGINVGHELGHRVKKGEQWLAKFLLMTSLYMHFYIEHNKGHHKHVATHHDPSSARFNEPLYLFYFRTIIFSYVNAWRIANREAEKLYGAAFHYKNEMLQAHVFQLLFLIIIGSVFGTSALLYFIAAALLGILLLETVNYIEHYGLERKQLPGKGYERAMPWHSWNSNHVLGRMMLFELSRHSDHHYLASRKYQVLRHHEDAPQLPTGYPGSMILAFIPPLWFYIMNKKIRKLRETSRTAQSSMLVAP